MLVSGVDTASLRYFRQRVDSEVLSVFAGGIFDNLRWGILNGRRPSP